MARHCPCSPSRQPACAWCVRRMARREQAADACLAQLQAACPGDDDTLDGEAEQRQLPLFQAPIP
jgi:hypothetical protein